MNKTPSVNNPVLGSTADASRAHDPGDGTSRPRVTTLFSTAHDLGGRDGAPTGTRPWTTSMNTHKAPPRGWVATERGEMLAGSGRSAGPRGAPGAVLEHEQHAQAAHRHGPGGGLGHGGQGDGVAEAGALRVLTVGARRPTVHQAVGVQAKAAGTHDAVEEVGRQVEK